MPQWRCNCETQEARKRRKTCLEEEGDEEDNQHAETGITERWVYDRERQRGGRPNGEAQGEHTLCPGDQVEGK